MPNSLTYAIAVLLLGAMFLLAFFSARQDALTFDELAHIPAGYSYLTRQDYRLNPEHPPLAKDIAALPLLFLNLLPTGRQVNFPDDSQSWLQEKEAPAWWVQFDLGKEFLYRSGPPGGEASNDPRQIIFWSRLPMIFLLLALGAFLFFWARKLLGPGWALLTLALFAFSPSFLAHGRLVTTDVASALGVLVALYCWIEFLKQPTKPNIVKASGALAFALLLKFSTVLLLPFFALITILYALLHPHSHGGVKTAGKYALLSVLAGIIALAVIIPVYQLHILNYPPERQMRDTISDLQPGGVTVYEQAVIWMADPPAGGLLLRPLAQFSRGILMAIQRGQFGNTVFLLGDIKAGGWWYYFPLIFLFKVPLALHVLLLFGFAGLALSIKKKGWEWAKNNFSLFAFGLFIVAYWGIAMTGNLNIGVRHLLPTFPFLYILGLYGVKEFASRRSTPRFKRNIKIALVLLFVAYIGSSLSAFPHYISYYNELAGGIKNGYKVSVDSNYDWGQDFYRLLAFVETNQIKKLHLDYFGGEDPEYWLGEKYERLDPFNPPTSGWVAVSVNQLMGGIAKPVAGFDQETGYYNWLLQYQPVERAGNSIFIYRLQ